MDPVVAKITKNGQISLPAEVRRRWGAERTVITDMGSYLIVGPTYDDAISRLKGSWGRWQPGDLSSEEMRELDRREEAANDERRFGA